MANIWRGIGNSETEEKRLNEVPHRSKNTIDAENDILRQTELYLTENFHKKQNIISNKLNDDITGNDKERYRRKRELRNSKQARRIIALTVLPN